MIHPYRQRRIELWIVAFISFGMSAFFLWICMHRDTLIVLWFAIPFAVLATMLSWKATRPDCVFQREQDREEAFFNKRPILASVLIVTSAIAGLWSIGAIIVRFIRWILSF